VACKQIAPAVVVRADCEPGLLLLRLSLMLSWLVLGVRAALVLRPLDPAATGEEVQPSVFLQSAAVVAAAAALQERF
jgi:hypothetical protein